MQAFDSRMAEVETALARLVTMHTEQHRLFTAFDDAYKRSLKSQLTEEIARLDTERDHCAAVVKETAKLWATHFKDVDEKLAVRGRRVLQPFIDFDFSTHESMVAENSKIENIEQVLSTAQLQADLQAMGLQAVNQMLATKTGQLIQLIDQRSQEMSGGEKGELRAAREALYAKYLELTEYINAVQVIQSEELHKPKENYKMVNYLCWAVRENSPFIYSHPHTPIFGTKLVRNYKNVHRYRKNGILRYFPKGST